MTTDPIEALALPSVRHRSFRKYFAGIKQSRVLQRINCLSDKLRVELRQHNRVNRLLVSTFVGSVMLFLSSLFLIVEVITTGYEIRHLESEMGVGLIRENELLEETVLHQYDAFMMRDVIAVSELLDDLSINPLDVVQKIASTLNRAEYVSLSSLNWKNVGDDWPKNNEHGSAPDSSLSQSSSMSKRILSDDDVDPLPRGQLSLVNAKSSAEGLFLVWLEAVLVGPCESVPDCYSLYSQFLVQLRSIEKFSAVVEIDKPFTTSGKSTFVGDRYRDDTANLEDPSSEALLTDENADARRFRILLVAEK